MVAQGFAKSTIKNTLEGKIKPKIIALNSATVFVSKAHQKLQRFLFQKRTKTALDCESW